MAYKSHLTKIKGKKSKEILVYTLSTCGWCAKTKALLNELGVEYSYVDVDLLNEADQKEVGNEFKKLKTDFAFPKIVIQNSCTKSRSLECSETRSVSDINKKVISGFNEEEIRRECG